MPDEEKVAEQQNVSTSKNKVGPLPEFVINILKYVAIAIVLIILMFVISFIVVRTVQGQSTPGTEPALSDNYKNIPPSLLWYKLIGVIQTPTSDTPPHRVAIDVHIGYFETDTVFQSELINQNSRITDLIRQFFRDKTVVELSNEGELKKELRDKINSILRSGEIQELAFVKFEIN